jgi:hypothetical protein
MPYRNLPLVVMLALAFAAPAAAAPPTPTTPRGTLTVEAGDLDRRNTPVRVAVPVDLSGRRMRLHGPGGVLPFTVDHEGEGVFTLPALKKGKQAVYKIEEFITLDEPKLGVVPDVAGIWVNVDGSKVLRYQTAGQAPLPDIKPEYVRGGYLHPVLTPGGALVTDDYPKDHRHHHGIWTAWTHTEYEGRTPDFWNMGQGKARKDHVSLGEVWPGDAAAGFIAHLSSTDLGVKPPRVVLKERWKVVVFRTHARKPPYFLFDLEARDELVGKAPLVLPEYRYGGLGVRGSAEWMEDAARAALLTSEGKGREDGEGGKARWVHMGGKVKGRQAGIAALDHPDNFRAPQPLRLPPKEPYFVYSPMKVGGAFSIEPGKPYVSRYRFVVADGPADKALLERLWNDYAHPPAARFAPPK